MQTAAPPTRSAGDWDARPAATAVGAVSLGALVVACLVAALLPRPLTTAGPALLVVAGLVGLPHGAVDHLALGWAGGRTGPARPTVLVAYATAAVGAAAAALAAPLPALLVLLALSVAHFAEGEVAFDRLRGGHGPVLPAAALATAVVVVPLELRPAAVRPLLAALDPGLPAFLAGARAPLLAVTAALVVAGLATALRAGRIRVAGELAVVAVTTVVAPPLIAFAMWFAGWHSARHLVRLAALEPDGTGRERLLRLARGAAPPTAAAACGLLALALLAGGLPGAVLVVLLALTVPHAAVVARLGSPSRAKPVCLGAEVI